MPRKTTGPGPAGPRSGAGFNEAAARCRGKPAALGWEQWTDPASMRPRPDAAENPVCVAYGVGTALAGLQ